MKSTKLLWSIVICLALGLLVSLLFNAGIIDLSKASKKSILPEKSSRKLQLSGIQMTLDREWSLPKGTAVIRLDFTVRNISKEPQTINQTELSVFDYNDCRYDVSTTFYSKRNPLQFSETLNPNNEKELSVIFEVPQNELYCIGFSNNIDCVGKQTFVDKIRNIKCEYETFKEMINVRDSLLKQPSKYKKEPKNKEEEIIPKVVFTEPKESVYESLTKKGTNPDEEIKVDLNDFLDQMEQMSQMGGIQEMLKMMPGGNKLSGAAVDEKQLARTKAIIQSMTMQERTNPRVLNASRRRRIAAGSGTTVQDVNRLLNQFEQMNKMIKQLSGKGKKKRRGFGGFGLPF